uniref:Odorant receptor n=1 Tax=Aphidius gifuensis TaxID=684658 RepID=A0A3S9LW88_APHGI|nr:odorant receptor [Aphidius gifuensis]
MISYLSVSILWCRIMGLLWYSDDNVYNWKRKLYKFYTGLIIFMEITMSLTEFIALFGSFNDAEEFANASFLLVTHICGCLKMINIIVKQNVISKLLSTLLDNNLQPRDDNETKILSIDGGRIRKVTIKYNFLVTFTISYFIISSLIRDIPLHQFPFSCTLPQILSTGKGYWVGYFYQIIAYYNIANIHIAFDILLYGLLMINCTHIKLLKYRISKINKYIEKMSYSKYNNNKKQIEYYYLKDCTKLQIFIYQFAKLLNGTFTYSIFIQYFVNSIAICSSAFQLTYTDTFSKEFGTLIVYIICMTLQIYLYCIFGENISSESDTLTFSLDEWTSLSINGKKSLIIMMLRSLKPIKYTCGYIVTLSLDAFTSILKLSYSIFNLLHQ